LNRYVYFAKIDACDEQGEWCDRSGSGSTANQ
jgi:hypothetical protein